MSFPLKSFEDFIKRFASNPDKQQQNIQLVRDFNQQAAEQRYIQQQLDRQKHSEIVRIHTPDGKTQTNTQIIGMSGTDPLGEFVVGNAILNKPLQLVGKSVLTGLARFGKPKKNMFNFLIPNAFDNQPKTIGEIITQQLKPKSMLTEEQNIQISKYANSKVDPLKSLKERMDNSSYIDKIKSNNNFYTGKIKYFEELRPNNIPQELIDNIGEMFLRENPQISTSKIQLDEAIKTYSINPNFKSWNPFSYQTTQGNPTGIVGIQDPKLFYNAPLKNSRMYNNYKAHETNHALTIPKRKPPIDTFGRTYFERQNGSEISARGTQIKNYFNKEEISPEELKYASENYVKDTGLDNNMTDLFNLIKKNEEKDPDIWKKMAEWFSDTSLAISPFMMFSGKKNIQE